MDSNLTAIGYQRETAWSVAADPVALKGLRFTKDSFEHAKTTVRSAEIRSDRQLAESLETGVDGKGGFDFELSVGTYDQFLESLLMGTYADVAGVSTLRNASTRTSYLIEKAFTGIDYVSYPGMMVDTLTLNLVSRQVIKGSFDFVGKGGVEAAATVDAAGGYDAISSGLILSASTNVGSITAGGAALAGAKSVTLTVSNNLRGNDAIGIKSIDAVGLGAFTVTGKIDAYFRTRALLQAFMAHSDSSLVFEVSREGAGAVAGDHVGYRFTVPKLKFSKGMPMIPGGNTDVMLPLEFEAEPGGGAGITMQVEKLVKA